MPQHKKEQEPLSIRLEKSVATRLRQYCDETGMAKTAAVEKALIMYINKYYEDKERIEKMYNE